MKYRVLNVSSGHCVLNIKMYVQKPIEQNEDRC